MAQLKQTVSVTNGSPAVVMPGGNFTTQVKANFIFMVAGENVPYTVAADATYDTVSGNTLFNLTGNYQGATSTSASGIVVTDYTSPDSIPTLRQGDVGTASVFTQAMTKIQSLLSNIGGLLTGHINNTNNPHTVTKTQIGLGSVQNVDTTNASNIVSGTLADAQLPTTMTGHTLANTTFSGTKAGLAKADVGLGNVDNTSDVNKPVSTAQQTALNGKIDKGGPTFRALCSGAPAIPSNATMVVPMDSEWWDPTNAFNNTGAAVGGVPAYAFMPTVPGYYQINGCVSMTVPNGSILYASIYKKGTELIRGTRTTTTTSGTYGLVVSDVMFFDGTTDYVTLVAYSSVGGNVEANISSFSGVFVRP